MIKEEMKHKQWKWRRQREESEVEWSWHSKEEAGSRDIVKRIEKSDQYFVEKMM